MKRRKFIGKGLAFSAGAASALFSRPATSSAGNRSRLRWRLALAVPRTAAVWGAGVERFAANVEKLSDGALNIRVYGAGELVPALETFSAVQSGEIQMGHSASYYWVGRLPASAFFCTVPFGMSAECLEAWLTQGDGQKLWDQLMHPHGVTCFAMGSTGYQMSGWFNKAINSIEDLRGLKIRIPGLASRVYARAGAIPVLLPGGEVFTGLLTGVIDAVEWIGPYSDYLMGLQRAARYYYGPSWHEPGATLELMINKKAWDELPEMLQFIIKISAAEAGIWIKSTWEAKNGHYLQKMRQEKIDVREFSPEVITELKRHSAEVLDEVAATSELAGRIRDSYLEFMRKFESYQKIATRTYYGAKWG